jgi:hypothetical protein
MIKIFDWTFVKSWPTNEETRHLALQGRRVSKHFEGFQDKCGFPFSSRAFFKPAEEIQRAFCVARFGSWIGERWRELHTVNHGMRSKTKGSPKDRSPAAGRLLPVASYCRVAHKSSVMRSAHGSGSAPKVSERQEGTGRTILRKLGIVDLCPLT